MICPEPRTAPRLVAQLLALFGPAAELVHAHEREWASITFSGARHRIVLELAEDAVATPTVQRALACLPEHEFCLSGEFVADCSATIGMPPLDGSVRKYRLIVVELLTVRAD